MTHEQLQAMTGAELLSAVKDGSANIGEVLAEMDRRATAAEQAAAVAAKNANSRTIKANSAGGLFIRDPAFKCWSTTKGKSYTGCLNCDPDLMRALVGSDGLLNEIREFLRTTGLTKFPAAPQPPTTPDNGNTGASVANQLVTPSPALAGRVRK